jgi:predicted transcriptional regulator
MVEIIALAVISVLAFFAGWVARERAAAHRINEMIGDTTEKIKEHIRENVIRIKIEYEHNQYYVYGLDDNTFMGQGKTQKEVEECLSSKFPGKTFAAEHSNLVEMGFVK